jgi:hypothetical protein
MRQFPDYKYISLIPIKNIGKELYKLAINKVILDVGLLLFKWLKPV